VYFPWFHDGKYDSFVPILIQGRVWTRQPKSVFTFPGTISSGFLKIPRHIIPLSATFGICWAIRCEPRCIFMLTKKEYGMPKKTNIFHDAECYGEHIVHRYKTFTFHIGI
jgi:hypothetical protein